MPEWMRSQFMAPAYALLISLAVALVLGLSMNEQALQGNQSQTQTTTTDPAPIRVAVKETDEPGKPTWDTPQELIGRPVTIRRVDSGEQLTVGKDGVIPRTVFDEPLRVCVELPGKWEGVDAEQGTNQRETCWKVEPGTDPIYLEVRRGG